MSDTIKQRADRAVMHALLCVVRLMEEDDTTTSTLVFRASMPSCGALFRDGENILSLGVAVERALELVEAE